MGHIFFSYLIISFYIFIFVSSQNKREHFNLIIKSQYFQMKLKVTFRWPFSTNTFQCENVFFFLQSSVMTKLDLYLRRLRIYFLHSVFDLQYNVKCACVTPISLSLTERTAKTTTRALTNRTSFHRWTAGSPWCQARRTSSRPRRVLTRTPCSCSRVIWATPARPRIPWPASAPRSRYTACKDTHINSRILYWDL